MTTLRRLCTLVIALISIAAIAHAALPRLTYDECQGSAMPYPEPDSLNILPDTLKPFFINHVGRHGARYPSSPNACHHVRQVLTKAQRRNMLTPLGAELLQVTNSVIDATGDRWGQLDSLGMAEQCGIAGRMYREFRDLLGNGARITAIASPKPRCVMSMYEFLHRLTLLTPVQPDITASSGPEYTPLLRFFDTDTAYRALLASGRLNAVYTPYADEMIPVRILDSLICPGLIADTAERRKLVTDIYSVVSGGAAMQLDTHAERFFTPDEYRALWAVKDLSQYLRYSASACSPIPAEMAAPLLENLITTADSAICGNAPAAILRFGHAETLMPLLSLMRLPGAYYLSPDVTNIPDRWRNYRLVPMAANLQLIYSRGPSGTVYVTVLLNEHPVPPLPDTDSPTVPWSTLRRHWLTLLHR